MRHSMSRISAAGFTSPTLSSGGIDEVSGAGLGYVSVFDLQGNFLGRVGSQGT
jgi:hypothetical protein